MNKKGKIQKIYVYQNVYLGILFAAFFWTKAYLVLAVCKEFKLWNFRVSLYSVCFLYQIWKQILFVFFVPIYAYLYTLLFIIMCPYIFFLFCYQIDLRRAYNCEIMLSKIKIPLPDMLVSWPIFIFFLLGELVDITSFISFSAVFLHDIILEF